MNILYNKIRFPFFKWGDLKIRKMIEREKMSNTKKDDKKPVSVWDKKPKRELLSDLEKENQKDQPKK